MASLRSMGSLWSRLRGWKPIWPSTNEERIGILCFEPAQLKQVVRADAQAHAPVQVELIGPDGSSVSSLTTTVAAVCAHGIRVHHYLLGPGRHELRMFAVGHRWRMVWPVGPTSAAQQRIARACQRHGTPVLFTQACSAAHYPYADDSLLPWFDRPDAHQTVEAWRRSGTIDARRAADLLHFVEHGYLEIHDALDSHWIEAVNAEVDAAIARGHQGYVMGSSQRLEQLHRPPGAMRRLWLNTGLRQRVEELFSGPARPAQTLAFVFGSQQDPHQDTIHLTPFPAGFMCGVWIALQDVEEGSGELVIYPGSHRSPRLRMDEQGCPKVQNLDWTEFGQRIVPIWETWARDREPIVYRPRKGSALIWHENLLHAGSPRRHPDRSRRSVVIHYYAADSIAYSDSTGEPAMAATSAELVAGH